jgi:hypothetical protein
MNKETALSFQEYLESKINASTIKQSDMAEELGYATPNIITMFKQGKTRVPIEKVPAFAKILGLDSKMLLRRAMLEYCPELFRAVENNFGAIITKNELEILNEIRRLSNGKDPGMTSIKSKLALERFVGEMSL